MQIKTIRVMIIMKGANSHSSLSLSLNPDSYYLAQKHSNESNTLKFKFAAGFIPALCIECVANTTTNVIFANCLSQHTQNLYKRKARKSEYRRIDDETKRQKHQANNQELIPPNTKWNIHGFCVCVVCRTFFD